MRSRIFLRCSSSSSIPKSRKGRKGRLYVADPERLPPTPEEEVRMTTRRHQKAERDERMDITLALTPNKTYMGGFTRPKDLRASNWFPGGQYVQKGKVYETPPTSAYVPHTVYLLETRYRVRHGIGRVDAYDHITGVCRAVDFVKLMAKYNSANCPGEAKESLDNACWPFIPNSGKVLKQTKWWGPDESLEDIMKEIYGEDEYDKDAMRRTLAEVGEEEEDDATDKVAGQNKKRRKSKGQQNLDPPSPLTVPDSSDPSKPSPHAVSSSTSESGVHLSMDDNNTEAPSLRESTERDSPSLVKSEPALEPAQLRAQYLPRLASEPFWRPLIAITVSTRPLALSLSRLAKAHERGTPYHATISNDDRKCLFSLGLRIRNYRINRFLQLTRAAAMRLAGYKGGLVGIRFGVNERGRGINGEALANPIPLDRRVMMVRVCDWYSRAQEVFESFEQGGQEWVGEGAVEVSYMNERGFRVDAQGNEIPEKLVEEDVEEIADMEEGEEDNDEEDEILRSPEDPVKRRKFKTALRLESEAAVALRRKLALKRAQGHRSVQGI